MHKPIKISFDDLKNINEINGVPITHFLFKSRILHDGQLDKYYGTIIITLTAKIDLNDLPDDIFTYVSGSFFKVRLMGTPNDDSYLYCLKPEGMEFSGSFYIEHATELNVDDKLIINNIEFANIITKMLIYKSKDIDDFKKNMSIRRI
jgi:hypothetical protein